MGWTPELDSWLSVYCSLPPRSDRLGYYHDFLHLCSSSHSFVVTLLRLNIHLFIFLHIYFFLSKFAVDSDDDTRLAQRSSSQACMINAPTSQTQPSSPDLFILSTQSHPDWLCQSATDWFICQATSSTLEVIRDNHNCQQEPQGPH